MIEYGRCLLYNDGDTNLIKSMSIVAFFTGVIDFPYGQDGGYTNDWKFSHLKGIIQACKAHSFLLAHDFHRFGSRPLFGKHKPARSCPGSTGWGYSQGLHGA